MDLKGIGCEGEGWINPAQDRDKWSKIVNVVGVHKCGKFLTR